MFYKGRIPWHGLGEAFEDDDMLSVDRAIDAAGCNWVARTLPLMISTNIEDYKFMEKDHRQAALDMFGGKFVSMQRGMGRDSDAKILSTVGPAYNALQNKKAFDFFQPYLDSGEAELHTGGSLCGGKKIWLLAKLNRDPVVIGKDDKVAKYLLLSNAHDGTQAVRIGFTPIRVVCANTLAMAQNSGASKLLRVWHSRKVETNLEKIQDIINIANASFEATAEQYQELASKQINKKDLAEYIKIVLDIKKVKNKKTGYEDYTTKSKNIMADITQRFEYGIGAEDVSTRHTVWNAYNAITEWMNHKRGHNVDSRMNSLWFGQSATINQKALKEAVSIVS